MYEGLTLGVCVYNGSRVFTRSLETHETRVFRYTHTVVLTDLANGQFSICNWAALLSLLSVSLSLLSVYSTPGFMLYLCRHNCPIDTMSNLGICHMWHFRGILVAGTYFTVVW